MVRGGGAYYGSPYANDNLKAKFTRLRFRLLHRGVFVDLGYVQSVWYSGIFPLSTRNKGSYAADIKNNSSHLVLTLGFKI